MHRRFSIFALFAVLASSYNSVSAAERPNVLFIVSDDLNTDLGCYKHSLMKSPNIDRLAARGTLFQKAYCQYPVCNPSRSSFMTGMYPTQTGVLSNGGNFRKRLPDVATLPQAFRQQGYFVARVGKIYHYGVPNQIGTNGEDDAASWEMVVNPRGIDREVHDQIHSLVKGQFGGTLSWLRMETKDEEHTDGIGATEAIRLLEEHHPQTTGKPFFLAVGFYRPHTPYVAPGHQFEKYPREAINPVLEKRGDRDDIPIAALADRPHQRDLTVPQRKEIIQAYYASISHMDAQVGRLLDALKRLELEKDTIVVFISDHGYHLGAHGLWQKGDLFEGSCHVPMIVSAPGLPQGQTSGAVAEMLDLYPTLMDLCGIEKPDHLQGQSLVPALKNAEDLGKPAALTVANSRAGALHPEMKGNTVLGYSIRTPRYRYTEWGENGEFGAELYDYQRDPEEFTNLATDPEQKQVMAQMRELMASARERSR